MPVGTGCYRHLVCVDGNDQFRASPMPVGTGCYRHFGDSVFIPEDTLSPMPVGTGCYRHEDGVICYDLNTFWRRQCLSAQGAIGTWTRGAVQVTYNDCRQCLSAQGAIGTLRYCSGSQCGSCRQCLSAQGAIGTPKGLSVLDDPKLSPMPVGTGCYRHGMRAGAVILERQVANACRHRVLSARGKGSPPPQRSRSRQCLSAQGAIGTPGAGAGGWQW